MIVKVVFDRPIPGLVTRDDPHPTAFLASEGYTIEEVDGWWIRLTSKDAGPRDVPQSRVIYVDRAPPLAGQASHDVAQLRGDLAAEARGKQQTDKARGKR